MADRADDRRGWSTRELADVAGTTVKAIRHYHRTGLLPEPQRLGNGYKQYGTEHLDRLLQILRMRDVGFSVAQVNEALLTEKCADRSSAAGTDGARTRQLLAEVDDAIARLQTIRNDLADSLHSGERWNHPPGFAQVAESLSDSDRLVSQVMARHFSPEAMAALRTLNESTDSIDVEFDQLAADAGEERIGDLAGRMAPHIRRARAKHPLPSPVVPADRAAEVRAAQAIGRVLGEVYNPAQLEVVIRALAIDDPHTHP